MPSATAQSDLSQALVTPAGGTTASKVADLAGWVVWADAQGIVAGGQFSPNPDGAITSGQNSLNSPSGIDSTAVGKQVVVPGAGANGGSLVATVLSVAGSHATLSANASATVSGVKIYVGGTDNTAKVQAALNFLGTLGGGTLRFRQGNYRIDGSVSWPAAHGMAVAGESDYVTTLCHTANSGGLFVLGSFDAALDYSGSGTRERYAFSNVRIQGIFDLRSPGAASVGVVDYECGGAVFRNVWLQGFSIGFWGIASDLDDFDGLTCHGNGVGMDLRALSDQQAFGSCLFEFNNVGLRLSGVRGVKLARPVFVNNYGPDLVLEGVFGADSDPFGNAYTSGVPTRGCHSVTLDTPWFEISGAGGQAQLAEKDSCVAVGLNGPAAYACTYNLKIRNAHVAGFADDPTLGPIVSAFLHTGWATGVEIDGLLIDNTGHSWPVHKAAQVGTYASVDGNTTVNLGHAEIRNVRYTAVENTLFFPGVRYGNQNAAHASEGVSVVTNPTLESSAFGWSLSRANSANYVMAVGRTLSDLTTTAGSNLIGSAGNGFLSSDVGQTVTLTGTNVGGPGVNTTVVEVRKVTNGGQATLYKGNLPQATLSGVTGVFGGELPVGANAGRTITPTTNVGGAASLHQDVLRLESNAAYKVVLRYKTSAGSANWQVGISAGGTFTGGNFFRLIPAADAFTTVEFIALTNNTSPGSPQLTLAYTGTNFNADSVTVNYFDCQLVSPYNVEAGRVRRLYGTAAPTSGGTTFFPGDQTYNSAPSPGQPMGWLCTAQGNPGTWAPFGLVAAASSSAPAVAAAGTITTSGVTVARVSPSAAVAGVVLQAGGYAGQEVWVVNEAAAANSVTFAASGTSNVADGTSDVVAGLTGRKFVWDAATSLWYRAA